MILFVAVCSLLGAVVYYSVAVAIKDSYVWVTGLVLTRQSVIAVAIGTFAVGGVLYVIRYHFRCIFGLTEIVVGVSIGTFKISSDTEINAEFYFVLLTAAIYLVVRGLDNFQQGLTKDPKDKLMKWLLKESQPIRRTLRRQYWAPLSCQRRIALKVFFFHLTGFLTRGTPQFCIGSDAKRFVMRMAAVGRKRRFESVPGS